MEEGLGAVGDEAVDLDELLAGEVLALLVRRDVRRACMMSSMCPRWGEGLAPPAALMMMMTRVRRASWARAGRSGGRSSSGPLAAAGRSSSCRSCTRKFTRGTFRAGLMSPPAGTRRFLAEVASRWCTSDRRCRQCHQVTASGRAGALGTSTKPTDDTSFEPQVQVFFRVLRGHCLASTTPHGPEENAVERRQEAKSAPPPQSRRGRSTSCGGVCSPHY